MAQFWFQSVPDATGAQLTWDDDLLRGSSTIEPPLLPPPTLTLVAPSFQFV